MKMASQSNQLRLMPILFTNKKKLGGLMEPILYDKPLTLTQEVKYLGVLLDRNLRWKSHVDEVISKR